MGGLSLLKLIKNEMTPKEKAKELVDKFKDYVHGYVGSSMLTNCEYPDQIISQAKKASMIAVDEIINAEFYKGIPNPHYLLPIEFWIEVKLELEK